MQDSVHTDLPIVSGKNSRHLIKDKRKTLLLIVIMALVGGLTVDMFLLFGKYLPKNSLTQQSEGSSEIKTYPVYPETKRAAGPNFEWEIGMIQPTVEGFESIDGADYILLNIDGKSVRGYISGVLKDTDLKGVYFADNGTSELLATSVFQKKLNIGDRIGVYYIEKYPAKTTRTEEYCETYGRLCPMADIAEALSLEGKLWEVALPSSESSILPIFEFYTELVSE